MIYFSSLLKTKLPNFCSNLEQILKKNKIEHSFLPSTKDIWCRDYMPIEVSKNKFVLFRYHPSYLKGAPELRTNNKLVCDKEGVNYTSSNIILDGGNVVRFNDKAILTNRIFSENKVKDGDSRLLSQLEKLLQAEIIIIPAEQDDIIGHADGMVRFLDGKTIFVNDYNKTSSSIAFQRKLYTAIKSFNLNIIPTPYFPDEKWIQKSKYDIPPATGVYINYLQVGDVILLPQFSNKEQNLKATEVFTKYFSKIVKIDCQDLAVLGGLLNCISWN